MKYIRKILFLLIIMIIAITKVNADSIKFKAGDYINNIYLKKESPNGVVKYMQAQFIIDESNNKYAYCLDPFINITLDNYYKKYSSIDHNILSIDEDKWEYINLLAYYGYGYSGHIAPEWYAATQIAIWRAMEPTSNIYFTDKLNGNRVNTNEYMVTEIQNLANNFLNMNKVVNINTTYDVPKIVDGLNSSFELSLDTDDLQINQNSQLILKKSFKGTKSYKIYFGNDNYSSFYLLDGYQRVLQVDNLIKYNLTYNITINTGKLILDFNILNNYYSNCSKEDVTKYGLYDINNNLLNEFNIEELSHFEINDLAYGKYYLKQISYGCSFKEDKNIYEININSDIQNKNIDVEKLSKEINIKKEYCLDDICIDEENAKFLIKDDNKEFEMVTNSEGKASINIGIGTYTLKQISGKKNYNYINDFNFNLLDYSSNKINFRLINTLKKGEINVIVKDEEENYIEDSKICLYDENKNLIKCDKTDKNGVVSFNNLKLGIYYINQQSVNEKYILQNVQEKIVLENISNINIINKQNNIINNSNEVINDLEEEKTNEENYNYSYKEEYLPDTNKNDFIKYIVLIICIIGISISLYVEAKENI